MPKLKNLPLAYGLSFIIAILIATVSSVGLQNPDMLYPTDELKQSFVPNDVVNLFLGLPILLISMWLTQRGKITGLLFWPGALFFVFYNYTVYLFAMPLTVMFLGYLALVTLSVYLLIYLLANIDSQAVYQQLRGAVPEKLASAVLVGFGLLFIARVAAMVVGALASQAQVSATELGLHIADFLIAPALVIGGGLLWLRRPLGYVAALGLLFQTSMLFVGLIAVLIIQPIMTTAPLALTDIVVVFLMGIIFAFPFILFVRGATRGKRGL